MTCLIWRCRQVTCEMSISKAFWRPCRKNYISGSTSHKSFIQMVKYSFPDKRIVYWSFLNINIISVSYAVDKLHAQLSAKTCNIDVCQSRTQKTIWQNRDLHVDPHLCEHQMAKIELLPSAFKPFWQWSQIVCIALNKSFFSFYADNPR